jgi:predicted transcriptional regulator
MDINKKIEKLGVKKQFVAKKIGISRELLSYYLNEKRPMPEHIKAKLYGFIKAMDKLKV